VSARTAPRAGAFRRAVRRAFTLTELLIVIGLIVLVIALAVPAFKAMSGGRSIDAAQNQLAAVLGAARAEAIGLQKVRGVFFYVDPATERVNAALVEETAAPPTATAAPFPEYYLDLMPDRDPVVLPVGVGLQGIDNADVGGPTAVRKDDAYVGYNRIMPTATPPPTPERAVRFGGVILFDGYGRVINRFYAFLLARQIVGGRPTDLEPTAMGELLGYEPASVPPVRYVPVQKLGGAAPLNGQPPQSLFGFILYDAEPFRTLEYSEGDPQFDDGDSQRIGTYSGKEIREETWLDKNAVPILINRYNGTLVRGE
jgi:type II secretory pathway pseudopilin PulG